MLIELEDGVDNLPAGDEVDAALSALALARRHGHHALFGSVRVLGALADRPSLASHERGVYRRVQSERFRLGGLIDHLPLRTVVSPDPAPPSIERRGDQEVIRLPLVWFAEPEAAAQTALVVEYITDADFYDALAHGFAQTVDLGVLKIHHDVRNGGGNTTHVVYGTLQGKARLTLAVADSDRFSPTGPLGPTAAALQDIDDVGVPHSRVVITGVREAENMVPIAVLRDAIDRYDPNNQAADALEEILRHVGPDVLGYLDLKKDTRGRTLDQLSASETAADAAFWSQNVEGLRAAGHRMELSCQQVTACPSPNACRCVVVPAAGRKALVWTTEYLNTLDPASMMGLIDSRVLDEWERIGSAVASWCCGLEPVTG